MSLGVVVLAGEVQGEHDAVDPGTRVVVLFDGAGSAGRTPGGQAPLGDSSGGWWESDQCDRLRGFAGPPEPQCS